MKFRPLTIILIVIVVALLTVVCGPTAPVSDPTAVSQSTPTVEALPTTIASEGPFLAGVPSWIKQGSQYEIRVGTGSRTVTVQEILDDGWVLVENPRLSGWWNVNSGVLVTQP